MGSNFNNHMAEQTREREPKKMNVKQFIWKLIKLWFKHGNLPVRTWVQYQGWRDLYEPEYEGHIYGEGKFISIY
jgi:hypothetical protein